ncbi:MAG TPA: DegT/DnrJ/EryC1/StrS family aminotransferase [Pyrinomonadaceae bacterium]|nr:DegT/DnrJ/EryC1/StrS family aminotransferase [Pyrinomonadaceae bacterium]
MKNVPLLDLQAQYETIRDEVRAAVDRVFDSQHFVLGGEVQVLEEEIARYSQTRFAIGCASGSDALLLALMSCGVGAGDEVITTPFSFFATAGAITRLGARPVFVDIDERTFNLNPNLIAGAITERTKAIIPVHLYGQCAEMDPLLALGREGWRRTAGKGTGAPIPIIEDAAQAIGAEDARRRAGSMGTIGCFSFYPSKNLGGAGDGGMLVTNDLDHARRLHMLRVHGEETKYHHQVVGINSRLDALQAAVLRVKLPHLEQWTTARQRKAQQYELMFIDAGLAEQIEVPFVRANARHIFHQFVIRIRDGRRDALREHLRACGVGTDIYYPVPLHLQKCFAYLGYQEGDLPVAELAAKETLALPVYPELTDEQQDYVVNMIAKFCEAPKT